MIEIAQHYARQGWPVFPLAPGGKKPVIPEERGGHGCHDATLDLTRIEAWWNEYQGANVGIATGRRSGLLVIDVDPRKTPEYLASMNVLALPNTFTVRTWSRGWHLYFRFDGNDKVTIGTNLLPGIDWRGNGGYVVGAGSVVNGVTYEIARNVPIAEAPAALVQRILAHRKGQRVAAVDASGRMVIPVSKRNDQLFRIACALRRFGVDVNAILESLRAVNSDHCASALDDAELRTIAASASKYAPDDGQHERNC